MSDPQEGTPPRFVVVEGDRFEADRDRAILSVARTVSAQYATEWAAGLSRLVSALPEFPGPRSHAQDEEASALSGQEVRRILYFGPARRRSKTPFRLLFSILPSDPEEPPETAETVLYLLRLLHGAQALQSDEAAE